MGQKFRPHLGHSSLHVRKSTCKIHIQKLHTQLSSTSQERHEVPSYVKFKPGDHYHNYIRVNKRIQEGSKNRSARA